MYRIEAWKWVASSKRIIGAWPGSLVLCFVCYIWIRRWNRRNMMMLSIKCFLDDRLRRKFIVKYRQLDRNTVTHFLLLRRTQFTCSIYFSILLGPIFTVWKTKNVQERAKSNVSRVKRITITSVISNIHQTCHHYMLTKYFHRNENIEF